MFFSKCQTGRAENSHAAAQIMPYCQKGAKNVDVFLHLLFSHASGRQEKQTHFHETGTPAIHNNTSHISHTPPHTAAVLTLVCTF